MTTLTHDEECPPSEQRQTAQATNSRYPPHQHKPYHNKHKNKHNTSSKNTTKGRRKGSQHKSSWFSIIFIFSLSVLLFYSCYQVYLSFPSPDEEAANADDVVKLVISNEEAEARVAESIRKYEEYSRQYNPPSVSFYSGVAFTSSAVRHTPPSYSLLWAWRHYFDIQPLRNLLIRAGLYRAPSTGDLTDGNSGAEGAGREEEEEEGPAQAGVYHIDTNGQLSEEQKKDRMAQETDFIAKRLEKKR